MMTQTTLDERVRTATGGRVPGVALVVVGAEGVRAHSAVGIADLLAQEPMGTDLAIPWFSMTKIATATTAIRMAERGILELDAPVLLLVPAMRSLRPTTWAERITARHLLQHSAGLANPIPVGGSIRRTHQVPTRTGSSQGCCPSTPSCASSRGPGPATPTSER